jgi:cob(I)alamin adenosyltransferase
MKTIFTKQGDAGTTTVYAGQRVSKTDLVVVANGAVDELNCSIGLALSSMPKKDDFETFHRQLLTVQRLLFKLGYSISAVGPTGESDSLEMFFEGKAVETLELWIEEIEKTVQPIKNFVVPGGHFCAALLHQARAICRRAERAVVALHSKRNIDTLSLPFLNRLSDYLFVLACQVNILTKEE